MGRKSSVGHEASSWVFCRADNAGVVGGGDSGGFLEGQ